MKILLAIDGSRFSNAAIDLLCETINTEQAEIEILSVVEKIVNHPGPFTLAPEYCNSIEDDWKKWAKEFAAAAEKRIRESFAGTKLKIAVKISNGSPKRVILEEAKNWGADLIIVGSHGYGFWSRTMLGSVSNSLIRHAPCPVLVVREKNSVQS